MKAKYLTLMGIGLLLISCNKSQNTSETDALESEITKIYTIHDQNQGTNNLNLDNGKKWKVNDEMIPHIRKAESIFNHFISEQNTSFDHQELAASLKEQNEKLIANCTMKGEAHDELHKWLMPHIKIIKALSETKTTTEAEPVIESLKGSFAAFNMYFE